MLHAASCLGRLLVPGCCWSSDFCGCIHSLIHFRQTSWNTTPSANSCPGARHLCSCDVTKIPLQDFKEAWPFLWVCACLSFGKNSIFLKSTCYALPALARLSPLMTNLVQVRGEPRLWQWGKGMAYPCCLSPASPQPGSCQLIHRVLDVIFPLHCRIKSLSVVQLYMFFTFSLLGALF